MQIKLFKIRSVDVKSISQLLKETFPKHTFYTENKPKWSLEAEGR